MGGLEISMSGLTTQQPPNIPRLAFANGELLSIAHGDQPTLLKVLILRT